MGFEEVEISHGHVRATVAPKRGGLVTSMSVGGTEVFYMDRATFEDPKKNVRGGIPVLFPFAGSLVNNAFQQRGTIIPQHGFARNMGWRVIEHQDSLIRLRMDRDEKTRDLFPYQYSLEMTLLVIPAGLHVELNILNLSDAPIPLSPGWHPYFACPAKEKDSVETDLDDVNQAEFQNGREFNFGVKAPLDGRISCRIPGLGKLEMDFSPDMRHVQFWSLPGRDFVCVEPFFGPPDTLNHPSERMEAAPHSARSLFMRLRFPDLEKGTAARDDSWEVFTETATVYSSPSFDSEPIAELKEGERAAGALYTHQETDEPWLIINYEGRNSYLSLTQVIRPAPPAAERNYPIGSEIVNRWHGIPLDYEPDDLAMIPAEWCFEPDRDYPLRKEPLRQLVTMLKAASAEEIDIRVCSAYRSGQRQKELYLDAVKKDGASQRYSAPPGHSEHQLGTTVDLVDKEGLELFTQSFAATPQGRWLEENAPSYGFRRTYREENKAETGYIPEPWHWRYVGVP